MKKQLLAFALIPSLLFGAVTVPFPKAASAATTGEVVSSVSFRQSPDENSPRIRYLKAGEPVSIIEKVNAYWYRVQVTNGQIGYVSTSSKYIKANGQTTSPATGTGRIVASVSFRTAANENASRIRYLKVGETVQILQKVNAYWYKVKASDGREGYISTSPTYISTSGGSTSPDTNTGGGTTSEKIQKVIAAGKKYIGTPYEYGSSRDNTATFDCSDFVRQAFLDGIGLKLPSDSRGQGAYVKSLGHNVTDWHNLKVGDLMFFMSYKGTAQSNYAGINKSTQTITHVAIYLGNGQILSTYSKESGGVRIDSIANRHWEYRFLFGGSAL
ncbi:SH3 domain-containing protein [Paenibacillus sp. LMG 31461]|uniref:SH3 domain-containing protein n=1 Tax=Paenibacillus plantarum TaxID=2654975 RepID=A0ABX1XBY0_9BACL|nr:SH3 domain-containing C40 family peptidase [Paenibacillus plantarum]NOU65962.1 SH3 domain-containing protein [Paenibacillus plantarum]